MREAAHEQRKWLVQRLAANLIRTTAIYLVVWAVLFGLYSVFVRERLDQFIRQATVVPIELTQEMYDQLFTEYLADGFSGDVEMEPMDDGRYRIIFLTEYNRIRSLKAPLAATIFIVGYAVLLIRMMQRYIGYVEEVGQGVSGMIEHRDVPVQLSPELAILQGEMNELRETTIAHERVARESERRKNELVAYLAHDLRTPLTSVVGYLSLLDEAPDLPEEQRCRYVGTALDKAETLDGLTAEFFEITRYNLSSIPIERENVRIDIFLDQIADQFYPEMQARSIEAHVEAPENETAFLDNEKMARAIGNVVRNAIAYADGGTTIDIVAKRKAAEGGWVISISDTGREIAPEHIERIFDQFMRVDSARSQNGHAGLGLAIAREIVQAHGGSIRAESERGVTTFTIELP